MSVSCIGLQDCFYSHYMHLFVYVCVFMRACVRACVRACHYVILASGTMMSVVIERSLINIRFLPPGRSHGVHGRIWIPRLEQTTSGE